VLDLKLILGCGAALTSVVVDVALRNLAAAWSSIRMGPLLPLLGQDTSSPNLSRKSRKTEW
jgi:hypothetical protein